MKIFRFTVLALAMGSGPFAGHAQDASWNIPYGASASENTAWNGSHRDANGNLEIVNGVIKTGAGSSSTLAQVTTNAGVGLQVGTATSTAIGNQLNVITTGKYNTVIVNSEQTNNGDVTAVSDTTLGGGDNDQG